MTVDFIAFMVQAAALALLLGALVFWWLGRFRKPRPVRIPIQPGHEATQIAFTHKGRVVAVCRLSEFTVDHFNGATAEFSDLSHFMVHSDDVDRPPHRQNPDHDGTG